MTVKETHEPCWHWTNGYVLCCHCLHEKTYPIPKNSEIWEVLKKPVHWVKSHSHTEKRQSK